MSDRDDLVEIVYAALVETDDVGDTQLREVAEVVADAIIAAGWPRRPQETPTSDPWQASIDEGREDDPRRVP